MMLNFSRWIADTYDELNFIILLRLAHQMYILMGLRKIGSVRFWLRIANYTVLGLIDQFFHFKIQENPNYKTVFILVCSR